MTRVIHVNTSDKHGGAARAAYRLHSGLKKIGLDSRMFVQEKKGHDDDIYGPDSKLGKLFAKIRPHIDQIPMSIYRHATVQDFSPAIVPSRATRKINALQPDIIHLHWLAKGFLQIESLSHFKQRSVVWTLHDSWAFTGGCHVPYPCTRYLERCGKCPSLESATEYDLSRWIWNRKARVLKALDLTIVTPSKWLGDCARQSSLFRDTPVEVIPNGIDIQTYKPLDQEFCREVLSLPKDKTVVMFSAMYSDKNKGFNYLASALRQITETGHNGKIIALVIGAAPEGGLDIGLDVRFLGKLHDDTSLAIAYSAADVFVAPSIQENLPNVVLEAMACAVPCVAFDIGGMPDMIDHRRSGYLAKPYEVEDLAKGILWVVEDRERRRGLSVCARQIIEGSFSESRAAQKYAALYDKLSAAHQDPR